MIEINEEINILFYHTDFQLLSDEGKEYLRQSHVDRTKQGKDV